MTTVSAAEVRSHLEYASRVLTAASDGERSDALSEQLLTFAHRALFVWNELVTLASDEQKDFYRGVLDELTGFTPCG